MLSGRSLPPEQPPPSQASLAPRWWVRLLLDLSLALEPLSWIPIQWKNHVVYINTGAGVCAPSRSEPPLPANTRPQCSLWLRSPFSHMPIGLLRSKSAQNAIFPSISGPFLSMGHNLPSFTLCWDMGHARRHLPSLS